MSERAGTAKTVCYSKTKRKSKLATGKCSGKGWKKVKNLNPKLKKVYATQANLFVRNQTGAAKVVKKAKFKPGWKRYTPKQLGLLPAATPITPAPAAPGESTPVDNPGGGTVLSSPFLINEDERGLGFVRVTLVNYDSDITYLTTATNGVAGSVTPCTDDTESPQYGRGCLTVTGLTSKQWTLISVVASLGSAKSSPGRINVHSGPFLPGIPQITGVVPGQSYADVAFTAATGEVDGYSYCLADCNDEINWYSVLGSSISWMLYNLTPATHYDILMRAYNESGVGQPSTSFGFDTLNATIDPPGVPSIASVNYDSGTSEIIVDFTPPLGGGPVQFYQYRYAPDNGQFNWETWQTIGGGSPLTISTSGWAAGSYLVQLQAVNDDGNGTEQTAQTIPVNVNVT